MARLLGDQTAVVTGAASGNGRAIARELATHGADVVVADVREEPRSGDVPTHGWIQSETDQDATFVECDVTDYDDIQAAMDGAEQFGGIDIMVNNAGVIRPGKLDELTVEDYDFLMEVNLKGIFLGTKVAAERMDSGSIINISSSVGIIGQPGNSIYSASKGGVALFTYSHAAELGPEIRVNAVHPGTTETKMVTEDIPLIGTEEGRKKKRDIPMERWGEPEDIAGAVVFLASDLASYITAESILVDGGLVNTR